MHYAALLIGFFEIKYLLVADIWANVTIEMHAH